MLNIAITFDYELFFGENYLPAEDILFSPTAELLKLFVRTDTRATFFADVCSVPLHQKYNIDSYVNRFTEQIKELYKNKQDIQLHIHSHWLKSVFSNGKWEFDKDSYRIHSFGFNEKSSDSVQDIIKKGKKYLVETLEPIDNDYLCIAYRAGGFCIQPTEQLFEILIKNGIYIDSSVLQHSSSNGFYDYKALPDKVNWWMSSNTGLIEDTDVARKRIFEVAIGSFRNRLKYPILYSYDKRYISFKNDKGTFIDFGIPKNTPQANLLKRIVNYDRTFTTLSTDSVDALMLIKGIDYIYKRYDASKNDLYISLIGHPKLVSDKTIDSLSRLISHVKKNSERYSFVTFRDIYDRISQLKFDQ